MQYSVVYIAIGSLHCTWKMANVHHVTVGGAKRRWICNVYSGYTCFTIITTGSGGH